MLCHVTFFRLKHRVHSVMGSLKFCGFLFLLLSLIVCVSSQTVEDQFKQFIKNHSRPYPVGSDEYYLRLKVFKDHVERLKVLNANRTSDDDAVYGITKFSDLTDDEFREKYLSPLKINTTRISTLNKKPLLFLSSDRKPNKLKIPAKMDWRNKNVVTPVQNQKSCGSCWAFAVTETIESSYALTKNGSLEDLSEQEMMDCSEGYEDSLHGCSGGDTCTAFDWMLTTKTALETEKQYPLTDKEQACRVPSSTVKGVRVSRYTCQNLASNEDLLLAQLASGPVSAAVDATTWNNYQGRIIQFHCGSAGLNHAVEIVGYDTTGSVPYYIVKNSWGTDWGDEGYVYIRIYGDVCGIASRISKVWTFFGGPS